MLYFGKWKIALIAVIILLGFGFAAPNLLSSRTAESLPDWLPRKQISLGLDLQGGSHLLMEVDIDTVTREWLTSVVDSVRIELRKERIGYTGLGVQGQSVTFALTDPERTDEALDLAAKVDSGLAVTASEAGQIRIALNEQAVIERR
jgi:preprotein translocase subunit SecD